jgi:membrane protein YdbS with pleckstrin-like domain
MSGKTWGVAGAVLGMIAGFLVMTLAWFALIWSLTAISSRWPQYEGTGGLIVLIVLVPFIAIPLIFVFLGWRMGHKLDLREN